MMNRTQTQSRLWRVLRFPAVRIVLAFACLILAILATQSVFRLLPFQGTIPVLVLSTGVLTLVACLTYSAFVRTVEKRPVTELAISGAVVELLTGALLGAFLFTITIGILWLLGYYKILGTNSWIIMVPVGAVTSAVFEEILFRGVLFRIVEEAMGTWLALLISALLFGLSHIFNPNATLIAAVAIALEAGVLLAAAYVLTRKLWLPMGIHFAWNFTQGRIFGMGGSEHQAKGLLQGTLVGPEFLSGGEFGVEASIIAVVVCLVASAFLLWNAFRKGAFVRPLWKR